MGGYVSESGMNMNNTRYAKKGTVKEDWFWFANNYDLSRRLKLFFFFSWTLNTLVLSLFFHSLKRN